MHEGFLISLQSRSVIKCRRVNFCLLCAWSSKFSTLSLIIPEHSSSALFLYFHWKGGGWIQLSQNHYSTLTRPEYISDHGQWISCPWFARLSHWATSHQMLHPVYKWISKNRHDQRERRTKTESDLIHVKHSTTSCSLLEDLNVHRLSIPSQSVKVARTTQELPHSCLTSDWDTPCYIDIQFRYVMIRQEWASILKNCYMSYMAPSPVSLWRVVSECVCGWVGVCVWWGGGGGGERERKGEGEPEDCRTGNNTRGKLQHLYFPVEIFKAYNCSLFKFNI